MWAWYPKGQLLQDHGGVVLASGRVQGKGQILIERDDFGLVLEYPINFPLNPTKKFVFQMPNWNNSNGMWLRISQVGLRIWYRLILL